MASRNEDIGASAVPVWNVETLRAHVLALLNAFDVRMTERHDAGMRAIDVAFQAQREAIATAFQTQEKAVNAALASADRAVQKAESAAEKRFEAVNEFRATLADQQRTLMPRSEAESRFVNLEQKLDSSSRTLKEAIQSNTDRLTASSGVKVGEKAGWAWAVAVGSVVVMLLGILAFFKGR